jgi:hypothetical protein
VQKSKATVLISSVAHAKDGLFARYSGQSFFFDHRLFALALRTGRILTLFLILEV